MDRFRSFRKTLRGQLVLGFAAVVALLVVVAGPGLFGLVFMNGKAGHIVHDIIPADAAIRTLELNLALQSELYLEYAVLGDEQLLKKAREKVPWFAEGFAELEGMVAGNPEQFQLVKTIEKQYDHFVEEYEIFVSHISSGESGMLGTSGAGDAGHAEDAAGGEHADPAVEALARIVESVDAVSAQIEQISAASEEVSASTDEMTRTIGLVRSVAESNASTVQQVRSSTSEISATMEEIAGVTEETSAATEEMSAAATTMAGQVQRVVGASDQQAAAVASLVEVIEGFRLADDGTEASPKRDSKKVAKPAVEELTPAVSVN